MIWHLLRFQCGSSKVRLIYAKLYTFVEVFINNRFLHDVVGSVGTFILKGQWELMLYPLKHESKVPLEMQQNDQSKPRERLSIRIEALNEI